eukprot:SAG31_NODE_441_length_15661_cov_17.905423_13_plen_186_part_00
MLWPELGELLGDSSSEEDAIPQNESASEPAVEAVTPLNREENHSSVEEVQNWQVGESAEQRAKREADEAAKRRMAAKILSTTGMSEIQRLTMAIDKLIRGERAPDMHELARPLQQFIEGFAVQEAQPAGALAAVRQMLEQARMLIQQQVRVHIPCADCFVFLFSFALPCLLTKRSRLLLFSVPMC